MMKNRSIQLFLIFSAVLCFSCTPATAEMRVWMDKSGNQFVGEFERELFGSVRIRTPDRRLVAIKKENLSESDLKYLRAAILPEIAISVSKKSKAKVRNNTFVRDGDDIFVVTLKVKVKKLSKDPYRGTLRAEVYLVGEEVNSDHYRLSGKKSSLVSFNEENQGVYEFSTTTDFRQYDEYNNLERRGAEYVGYLVVVFDSEGNRMEYKKTLSWLKEEKIDKLRSYSVGSFFDGNCRKRSVPRPLSHRL